MRLLSTDLRRGPRLREFIGDRVPHYAILSHTWENEGEVTFQHVQSGTYKKLKGYAKIKGACRQAAQHDYEWIWIDTCCIDKTSSAELSEAINTMYRWYANAGICYAYLADFTASGGLAGCRWFGRGWTLQELLASESIIFYDQSWNDLGTKSSLKIIISRITHIGLSFLSGASFADQPAAVKLSWASERKTAREEDMAYCLLGLFQVNMPLLYGEGGPSAFFRLQEEIMRRRIDHSLLVWSDLENNLVAGTFRDTVLASSPRCFTPSLLAEKGVYDLHALQLLPPKHYRLLGQTRQSSDEPFSLDSQITVQPSQLGLWMGYARTIETNNWMGTMLLITNVHLDGAVVCLVVHDREYSGEDMVRSYYFDGELTLVNIEALRDKIGWAEPFHYRPLLLVPTAEYRHILKAIFNDVQLTWRTLDRKRTVRQSRTRNHEIMHQIYQSESFSVLYAILLTSDAGYDFPPYLVLMAKIFSEAQVGVQLRSEALYTGDIAHVSWDMYKFWRPISWGPDSSDRCLILHNGGVITCSATLSSVSIDKWGTAGYNLRIEVEEQLHQLGPNTFPSLRLHAAWQYEVGLSLPATDAEALLLWGEETYDPIYDWYPVSINLPIQSQDSPAPPSSSWELIFYSALLACCVTNFLTSQNVDGLDIAFLILSCVPLGFGRFIPRKLLRLQVYCIVAYLLHKILGVPKSWPLIALLPLVWHLFENAVKLLLEPQQGHGSDA